MKTGQEATAAMSEPPASQGSAPDYSAVKASFRANAIAGAARSLPNFGRDALHPVSSEDQLASSPSRAERGGRFVGTLKGLSGSLKIKVPRGDGASDPFMRLVKEMAYRDFIRLDALPTLPKQLSHEPAAESPLLQPGEESLAVSAPVAAPVDACHQSSEDGASDPFMRLGSGFDMPESPSLAFHREATFNTIRLRPLYKEPSPEPSAESPLPELGDESSARSPLPAQQLLAPQLPTPNYEAVRASFRAKAVAGAARSRPDFDRDACPVCSEEDTRTLPLHLASRRGRSKPRAPASSPACSPRASAASALLSVAE
ncbi:hypothetical protein T484DRAFT_1815970 [Baffinella frigidus]|nr:hypothetical protein T484DRAFT_1815970 [Cryptophyta sp. CCMP2293]